MRLDVASHAGGTTGLARVPRMALVMVLMMAPVLSPGLVQAAEGDEIPRSLALEPLALGKIKPAGWLEGQLRIQAEGLSGHLDEFWPDIKESAWIGGKAEGWERVPYWLDGLVPLAYLLDDAALKAKVQRYVDYILEHQAADGWLGPVGDSQKHKAYDVWPLFPLIKALTQYQEATGDERVIPSLLKCSRKMGEVIDKEPLYSWAKVRAADWVVSLYWLYDRTGEGWLLDVARKAFQQSHDWAAQYASDEELAARYKNRVTEKEGTDLTTHGVNTGMALKYGPVRWRLTGADSDKKQAEVMLGLLDRYHGQANGIFTCDEHLAGRSPSQGTELCTVVEAMYALEEAIAATGDMRLADRLERLAFNALPATFKKDMTAHQYDQQANQVVCTREGEHVWATNGPEANTFGLEPNFGCCTANMHQGWPKFASRLAMKSGDGDEGVVVVSYAPCRIEATVKGKPVTVVVKTEYPFKEEVVFEVTVPEAMSFPLGLRIPGWAPLVVFEGSGLSAKISGKRVNAEVGGGGVGGGTRSKWTANLSGCGGEVVRLLGQWEGTKAFTMRLGMPIALWMGQGGSVAVERGPLVMSMPVPAEWKMVKDRPGMPFDEYDVLPAGPWNYGLEIDLEHPEEGTRVEERPVGSVPFSEEGAPLWVSVKGRKVPGWALERGAAAPPPESPIVSAEPLEELRLIPYGCTDLRVTEFPLLKPR